MRHVWLLMATAFLAGWPCYGIELPDDLSARAGQILRNYCYRCHKGEGSESGFAFDVTDIASMVDGGVLADKGDAAELHEQMYRNRMPPKNRPQLPRPSAEEVAIIKQWIDEGSKPFPQIEPRRPIPLADSLQSIHDHLAKADRADVPHLRYFSLDHLFNDPTIDEAYLDTVRLALTKALNSLSWEDRLVIPQAIDPAKTIYAVDLRKLGWTRAHWNACLQLYPYALGYEADRTLDELDRKIDRLRGSQETYVLRADWTVAVATKPPLYYGLLYDLHLPALTKRPSDTKQPANPKAMTTLHLEEELGINRLKNIVEGKAQRAAFTESGVSGQNRMIERHSLGRNRYYWISYDFKSSNRSAILGEFPLGPVFQGNAFNALAFEHDGGEVIFSLPNGLQGYLLVDGPGNRIDAGPIEVVADSLKTSGNEQIVSGVSCIACHREGMIESPDDQVRGVTSAAGDALRQVERLYPENAAFKELIAADRDTFNHVMHELLQKTFSKKIDFEELAEPVGEVARRYHLETLTIDRVAAELHVSRADLEGQLRGNPTLHSLGLRVLLRDGGIKRAMWESPAAFPLMKQTAREFSFSPK
jgi:hypothetical protein